MSVQVIPLWSIRVTKEFRDFDDKFEEMTRRRYTLYKSDSTFPAIVMTLTEVRLLKELFDKIEIK